MSITVYSGTPGSGKTLHAVADVRDALNRRYPLPVVANFEMDTKGLRGKYLYLDNYTLTPGKLCDYADEYWDTSGRPFREDRILLVLDECSLIFNARNWNSKGTAGRRDSRMDWLEFMSQHRKYGYRIILIAQSAKMIDNQFRMLVDDEVNHRRMDRLGAIGCLLGALTGHRLFLLVHLLFQTRERLGLRLFLRTDAVSRMYDTCGRLTQVRASGGTRSHHW